MGLNLIKITQCGLIRSINNATGEMACADGTEYFEEITVPEGTVGESIYLELLAKENPASNSSATLKIQHELNPSIVTEL